eukprot:4368875-Amphidinium_carterae.1
MALAFNGLALAPNSERHTWESRSSAQVMAQPRFTAVVVAVSLYSTVLLCCRKMHSGCIAMSSSALRDVAAVRHPK